MRINHNIAALNTYNKLNSASAAQSKSMEKLASGQRINRAGDDAAGLAISEKMRGQIRGLDMASKNAQDGISLIATAEGALNETHSILQRMKELSTQASNDTNTTADRGEIQKEMNQLTSEINRIGNTTEFNTQKLLNGTKTGAGSPAVPANPGSPATTLSSATNMTADVGNMATGNMTLQGTYSGATNTTLTVEKTATGYSIDGGVTDALTDAAIGGGTTTFTTDGMTVDVSSVASATTGDSFTYSLNAEVTATPGSPATPGGAVSLQIGANQGQQFSVEINDMRSAALGVSGTTGGATATGIDSNDAVTGASFTATGATNQLTDASASGTPEYALDLSSSTKASAAIKVVDQAIASVSAERSRLGAYQNRLEHTINNLGTSSENLTAAESRIRDVDYALAA
ncbi:flagellin [Metabacillus indicus]|uniref:flagellin N-terminal helical domain-containing protein n=1 Tax=Metabacillus indicus TaxID=246786 RepID=UPI00049330C2|nr:flagellin [Metabacillus indicus]KEZ48749.1 flagellin [Metabacillus indicus LMG 22858]